MRSAMASTSFSLWLMKMIDLPSAWSERMIGRAPPPPAASDGRRLVQDEDLGAAERLQDLHALLHPDGDRLDARLGTNGEPEARGDLSDLLVGGIEVEERPGCGSTPSTMFSATVMTGMSMKCWCTMPMPASIAARGESMRTRSPTQTDLALVRVVEPVEDVHERGLAGAVLAEERRTSPGEVEVHVVVRDDAGEPLRDACSRRGAPPWARKTRGGPVPAPRRGVTNRTWPAGRSPR